MHLIQKTLHGRCNPSGKRGRRQGLHGIWIGSRSMRAQLVNTASGSSLYSTYYRIHVSKGFAFIFFPYMLWNACIQVSCSSRNCRKGGRLFILKGNIFDIFRTSALFERWIFSKGINHYTCSCQTVGGFVRNMCKVYVGIFSRRNTNMNSIQSRVSTI